MRWWDAVVFTATLVLLTALILRGIGGGDQALRAAMVQGVMVIALIAVVGAQWSAFGFSRGGDPEWSWGSAWRSSWRGLGLRRVNRSTLVWAFGIGLALQLLLSELAHNLQPWWPLSAEAQRRLQQLAMPSSIELAWANALGVALVAPCSEEVFFRGFLLFALRCRYSATVSVLCSAALFGASHIEPVALAYAMVAGVVLGLIALWCESIFPAIVAHSAANGLPLLLFGVGWDIPGMQWPTSSAQHLPPAAIMVASMVLATGMWRLQRRAVLN